MPKPLKKSKPPVKPKRPTDPNRAARAMLAEHMARVPEETVAEPEAPLDFTAQFKAHMRKLGSKGGKVGGKRRLETMTQAERSATALKAARARWSKAKGRT